MLIVLKLNKARNAAYFALSYFTSGVLLKSSELVDFFLRDQDLANIFLS